MSVVNLDPPDRVYDLDSSFRWNDGCGWGRNFPASALVECSIKRAKRTLRRRRHGTRLRFTQFANRLIKLALRHNTHLDTLADFPHAAHIGHHCFIGLVDVDRHADHRPGGQAGQPEGFDAIALRIAEVKSDSAGMGYQPVDGVSLSMTRRLKSRTSSSDLTRSEIC